MEKLSKEEFVQRVLADKAKKKKENDGIYFAYAKERRLDADKKYKWPKKSAKII